MEGLFILVLGILFVVLFIWSLRTPSRWEQLIEAASESGDIEALTEELMRRPEILQPRFFHEAMNTLVHTNQDVAVRFTIAFAPAHPENKHTQYWLTELQSMEATAALLPTEFIEKHHRPSCSPAGG